MSTQPAPESTLHKVNRKVRWTVRRRWPDRVVEREVQGVRLALPWSHRLPDYAAVFPDYGQNLVALAAELGRSSTPLQVVDVGANVGDSTLQILNVTDARVLCVEGDAYWLDFLRRNVGQHDAVAIHPGLLVAGPATEGDGLAPVRSGGTTRFAPGGSGAVAPAVSIGDLAAAHPGFDAVRLIKSDTDGYDVLLVPALAAAWPESRPVLFFEFDPRLTRIAGNDPAPVWAELAELGYQDVAVWDNFGEPLGRLPIGQVSAATATLDLDPADHGYWDVAVAHADDEAGLAALSALVPGALAV